MSTGTIKYSQPNSLTGGGQTTQTGTAPPTTLSPSTPASGANFSSITGAQQQVTPNGQVISSTQQQNPNASYNAPNFSSITGQQIYVPPPNMVPGQNNTGVTPNSTPSGTVSAASPLQQAWASTPGQFISGVKESIMNPGATGETLQTGSNAASAGALVGVLGQIYSLAGVADGVAALAETDVSALSKVGTLGRAGKISTTAGSISTNSATLAKTTTWLTKVASATTSPGTVATLLVSSIGSYPFAGFLKEEALQTLGFATKSALDKGNLVDAQSALDMQKQVLHPDVIRQIMAAVPFANVLASLKDFFSAAELKVGVDQHIINNMVAVTDANASFPTGGTSSQSFWDKSAADRKAATDQQHAADEEYYKQVAQRMAEAKAASRAEDEAYWKKINDARDAQTAAKKKEEDAYWAAYYTRVNALQTPKKEAAASYSKLNFGLLK